jgi:WD40 repeat protein
LAAGDAVAIWNFSDPPRHLDESPGGASVVAFGPNGEWIAVASSEGRLKLLNSESGDEIGSVDLQAKGLRAMAVSPARDRIAAGAEDGTIALWKVGHQDAPRVLESKAGAVLSIAFAADGSRLAAAAETSVLLIDAATGQQLCQLQEKGAAIRAVAFSSDGRLFAFGGDFGAVRLRDAGKLLGRPQKKDADCQ